MFQIFKALRLKSKEPGKIILPLGACKSHFYIILEGEVEMVGEKGDPVKRLARGEGIGEEQLMDNYLASGYDFRVAQGGAMLAKIDSQEIASYLMQKDASFMSAEIAYLKNFQIFKTLSRQEMGHLAFQLNYYVVSKGSVAIRKGSRKVYFIKSGSLRRNEFPGQTLESQIIGLQLIAQNQSIKQDFYVQSDFCELYSLEMRVIFRYLKQQSCILINESKLRNSQSSQAVTTLREIPRVQSQEIEESPVEKYRVARKIP